MKRLCIFSFYDKDGFVDDYVLYLLKQIKANVTSLIFVSNGCIQSSFKNELNDIADSVICRENRGFDAGAYKSILVHSFEKEDLYKYDEVILCNNTFYGPIIPLGNILDVMEKKNYDFWGLNYVTPTTVDHIQSYFLAFRENIIKSDLIYDFFRDYIDEFDTDIDNAYVEFETGITQFFIKHGFSIGSFATPNICDIYKSCNYGVKKYGIPIIKNKVVLENENTKDNFIDALQYVERNTTYDINLIKKHLKRKNINISNYNKTNLTTKEYVHFNMHNSVDFIKKFTEKYEYVYIYGAGVIARKIYRFYNLKNVKAFIISDGQMKKHEELYGLPVLFNSQIDNCDAVGVVVAMNSYNLGQINTDICRFSNVIYL